MTYCRSLRPPQFTMTGTDPCVSSRSPSAHLYADDDSVLAVPAEAVSQTSNGLSMAAAQAASLRLYTATYPMCEPAGTRIDSHSSEEALSNPLPQNESRSPSIAFAAAKFALFCQTVLNVAVSGVI